VAKKSLIFIIFQNRRVEYKISTIILTFYKKIVTNVMNN